MAKAKTAPARPRVGARRTEVPGRPPVAVGMRARALERSYYAFTRYFWEIAESETRFEGNWHLEYLAGILQAEVERVAAGRPKVGGDIVVNIPPRSMKSYLCTIMLNAWAWARWPHLKFITCSFSGALASDHAMKTRRIIQSPEYRAMWGRVFEIRDDQDTKAWYETDKGGLRKTAGTGGGITGYGADIFIVDDPINPAEPTEAAYAEAARWWDDVAYLRLNRQDIGVRILVSQRLDERDLPGYVMERAKKSGRPLRRVILPAEDNWNVEPDELRERYVDGLLWPARFPRDVLEDLKVGMGSTGYANQMGQAPSPGEGALFKREWFKRWDRLPETWDDVIGSWDLSFKAERDSSYVVGQVWGVSGERAYLLDVVREKMTFVQTRAAIRATREKWPDCYTHLIEDKANGPAIIDDLRDEMGGIIAVAKGKGKVEMASAASPLYESGAVLIPDGPIGDAFLSEHLVFPNGRYDDQVDAAAQFVVYWMKRNARSQKIASIIKPRTDYLERRPTRYRGLE